MSRPEGPADPLLGTLAGCSGARLVVVLTGAAAAPAHAPCLVAQPEDASQGARYCNVHLAGTALTGLHRLLPDSPIE
jgi:hypothetical protein